MLNPDKEACQNCSDLMDTLANMSPSAKQKAVKGLKHALTLLAPFQDEGLSLGLGMEALTPITEALEAIQND